MATPNTTNRRLRIFRMKDGLRIPYTIELDDTLTVVAEYADMTELEHIAAGRRNRPASEVNEERRKGMLVARWATEAVIENPIPGTDQLREDYFDSLRELKEQFAARGEKCPGCKMGALIRSFREKLESGGWLK